MATATPTGPSSLPPQQPQSTSMQVDGSPSNSQTIPKLSWEGDKMFNIYIHDYCNKRGFTNTARELHREAELGSDYAPPIDARQGLLFEWWSVFWVLFQAKSGNVNSEDALLYTQHQNAQKARMQNAGNGPQPGGPTPLPGQPSLVAPNQPPQQQQQPGQPPMGRLPNGMPVRPSSAYMANGAMPNGIVNPTIGGQPNQPGQQQMQPGPGGHMSFGGLGTQPNGMPGSQQPPHAGPQQGSATQPIPFNAAMMTGPTGPRPPLNGHPLQPGQQQGRAPFTSPQMAHSPQTGGPGGGQPPQGGPGQQQAPMAQLGGPSPQMNRAMQPPNGAHPQGMGPPTPGASGPPTPGFTPGVIGPNAGARPPSRTRPTPSPSMASRQPPGATQPQQQQLQQQPGGMGIMGGIMGMGAMGVPGMNMGGPLGNMPTLGGIPHPGMNQEHFVQQELIHIPQPALNSLMQEHSLGDKELQALSTSDKMRLVSAWRQKNQLSGGPQAQKVGPPQGGHSGMMMPGQQQPQPGGSQQRSGPQPPLQPQQVVRVKRNSTSPAEDDSQQPNESSPPERKRIKRSPAQHPAIPPGTGPYAQHLGQQGLSGPPGSAPPGTPQQQPGQPPNVQQLNQPQPMMMIQRAHQMGNPMNGVGPSGQQPGTQGGHPVSQPQVGMPMMGMHGPMQPGLQQNFRPGLPAGPRSGPTQFSPTPLTQYGMNKPNPGQPQQSPGMNGPGKDMKDIKPPMTVQPNASSGPHSGSPRNQPTSATHTPVPSNQPTPNRPPSGPPGLQGGGPGGPSQPPPPSQTPNQPQGQPQQSQMMNSMLSMPMSGMNMNPGDLSMFDAAEFMGMESFDVFAGKGEGDMSFEREFGQWLDDPSSALEMK